MSGSHIPVRGFPCDSWRRFAHGPSATQSEPRQDRVPRVRWTFRGAIRSGEVTPLTDVCLQQTAAVTVSDAMRAAGARAGFIALVADCGATLELTTTLGFPRGFADRYCRTPLASPLPCAHAARSGEPMFFGSIDAVAARSPGVADALRPVGDAFAFLPLGFDGRRPGSLGLAFGEQRSFGGSEAELLAGLARLCADGLDRAALSAALRSAVQARERLAAIVERFEDAVILVDADLRVEFMNSHAVDLFRAWGFQAAQRLPDRWRGLALRPMIDQLASAEQDGEARRLVMCSDDERFELTAVPASGGSVLLRIRRSALDEARVDATIVRSRPADAHDALARISSALSALQQFAGSFADTRNDVTVAQAGDAAPGITLERDARLGIVSNDGVSSTRCLVGNVEIDRLGHEVTVDGRQVQLTPSEFRLLTLLAQRPGQVVSRGKIVRHLWQSGHVGDGRMCDGHVANLRRKIEPDPARPRRLITVRGEGYKLSAG